MNIAIIGTGISGLSCAYLLQQKHQVTVFESAERIGGHTATIPLEYEGKQYNIDTGFIVYNDWTYPNFIRLMEKLNIATKPTDMGFSVTCQQTGLEYSGSNLDTLFCQRRNLFNFSFLGMLKDILRFNKQAIRDLETNQLDESITLGEYLKLKGYGKQFASHYLVPMGSAIWSSTLQEMMDFPLIFFVRFFKNHGLLSVNDRPQWRVLEGGSSRYLAPLTETYKDHIHLNSTILSVKRDSKGVLLTYSLEHSGKIQEARFDQVVFACHSDQALTLLGDDATQEESEILGAIPYRKNEVVLHTDISLLPANRKAWSSWNYNLGTDLQAPATLSYNMNILQGIDSETTFVVTLNNSKRIAPEKILGTYYYSHPVFTLEGIQAQARWADINGVKNTWFCGAYWRNGFHEDGCVSGIQVAEKLGITW
ncbi:FAD-dependent oxidoreductase [Marinomonas agarivorans]|nr:FAD-dependent oxidoreductase [Marinomonas agarivorans]